MTRAGLQAAATNRPAVTSAIPTRCFEFLMEIPFPIPASLNADDATLSPSDGLQQASRVQNWSVTGSLWARARLAVARIRQVLSIRSFFTVVSSAYNP